MTEHLACFFRQSGRGVEQALVVTQRGVDRARRALLIRVQIGAVAHEYVTRGSAFAYATSVMRFTSTNTALRNSTEP